MSTAESGFQINDSCSPIRQRRLTYPGLASVHEEVSFETFEPFILEALLLHTAFTLCLCHDPSTVQKAVISTGQGIR